MSLQVHAFRAYAAPSASATNFISALQGQYFTATEHSGTAIACAAGTFGNWSITLPSAPGSGKSFTFTLRVNQADTAAVITISNTATTGTYVATTIALAADDEITIKCVPSGTPTASTPSFAWDFNSTTGSQSLYGTGNVNGTGIFSNRQANPLFRADRTAWGATSGQMPEVVACPGTLTKFTCKLAAAPGATKALTVNLVLNSVVQDGTGGTANTTLSFGAADTKKTATFSLAIVAGDLLLYQLVFTNAPTVNIIHGLTLTSTTAGDSQYGCVGDPNMDNANATKYVGVGAGDGITAYSATETNVAVTTGLSGFSLAKLYIRVSSALGAGRYDFTLRKNTADASLTTFVQSAGPTTTNNDTSNIVTVAAGDVLAMKMVSSSSPAARQMNFGMVQSTASSGGGGGQPARLRLHDMGVQAFPTGGAGTVNIGNPGIAINEITEDEITEDERQAA